MPPHTLAASGFLALALSIAPIFYLLLLQDHIRLRYAGATILVGLEWVLGTLVYRLTLHPLAKYPGPLVGALTDWYTVYWIANGGRHLDLHRQHVKYGKYVRYGPNRISINSPAASHDLHNVNSNTLKADAYGSFKRFFGAEMSLTTVDHKVHAFRRRVNVQAITPAAVREFEHLVHPHLDVFGEIIAEGAGNNSDGEYGWSPAKDMSNVIAFCIADIMGSVTFGRTWNVQKEVANRRFVKDLPKGVAGIHLVGHMQSLFFCNLHEILFKELIQGVKQLMDLSRSFALWRMEQKSMPNPDIWAALLASRDPKSGTAFTPEELISEASLFIIGGTDGMITSVTSTLFYLVHNEAALRRVTREIREAFPLPAESVGKRASEVPCPIRFASKELQNVKYLFACIDEAMRISPPVPSVLPRAVGPGGLMVDGEFFPEGVNLGVPHYSLQRSEEYFPKPLFYIPERWMDGERNAPCPDGTNLPLGRDPDAMQPGTGHSPGFTPFGAGRSSCIGKHLAYQEMSIILATMLWTFDIRRDPNNALGEGTGMGTWGRDRRDEFQLFDCFVSSQKGPMVQFRYREELVA